MKKKDDAINRKGNKPITPTNDAKVKAQHMTSAGHFTRPRGAANSASGGRASNAMRGGKKK